MNVRRQAEAKVEAIPLPERGAPQALLGVLGAAIAAAALFSQAIPLVLGS